MPDTDKSSPRPNAYGTPWEYENVSVCSDRTAYVVVKDDNGKALFDTINSDVATIATEHDEHGATYFDTAGQFYLSHAVRCVNAHDALVAALKEARGVLTTLAVALPAGSLTHELIGRCDTALKLAEVP